MGDSAEAISHGDIA